MTVTRMRNENLTSPWIEPSITSFEAFRISYDRSRAMGMPGPQPPQLDSVPEAELRKRYEVLRADRIARAKFQATQEIVTQSLHS